MINMNKISPLIDVSNEVMDSLIGDYPIVALESTVITHGLPYPQNIEIALDMESKVRKAASIPATIAVMNGRIKVGLSEEELQELAVSNNSHKISVREYGPAIAKKWSGGTTVAGTIFIANKLDINVFATGGIGGVHRVVEPSKRFAVDISADLNQLASTPIVVVCAGAKAILDLEATVEYLETNSIPVVGFQTNKFPSFYSRSSGLATSARADSPEEIVAIARSHWQIGMQSAVLVGNPLPEEDSVDNLIIEQAVSGAIREVSEFHISGQDVTPFLLKRVAEITKGDSLRANLKLLKNNAALGGEIAKRFASN